MADKKKPGAKRVKPLRAHDHIKKDTIVESHPKFHPKRHPQKDPKLDPKKEKRMATEVKATTAKAPAVEAPAAQVDPRVMQVVIALLPAASAEEQKKVGEAVQKLFDSAQPKA